MLRMTLKWVFVFYWHLVDLQCYIHFRHTTLLLMFSHTVVSDSLWPHGLQYTRPPCPSSSPGICPSSCSLHWWCRPAISFSDALFSFCPQSFPASGTFPKSHHWPKYWSFSFSISIFSEYSGLISLKTDWFDLLAVQGMFRSLLQHHNLKASILWHSAFFTVQLSTIHDHYEDHSLDYMDLCWQSNVCFSTHCLGLSFLSCQEGSSSDFMATVTIHSDFFGAQEEEICHYFQFFPFYLPCSNEARCHGFSFFNI